MSSESISENTRQQQGKGTPIKRLPKPSGQTLHELISQFRRPDGTQGLRVRELTRAMHVAAETLGIAIDEPERLSMASIFGLAELLNITPDQLVADLFHQVSLRPEFGRTPAGVRPRVHRRRPAATDAAASSEQGKEKTAPTSARVNQADELPPAAPGDATEPNAADSPPNTDYQIVRYVDASLRQRTLALASVQEDLKHHFPTLPLPQWATEMEALQPDLWLEGEEVTIVYEDLVRLTQRLAWTPNRVPLEPPIHSLQSLYLARRSSEYAHIAILALAEMEQNPLAYGKYTRIIILKMAAGNGVADEIIQAFGESHPVKAGPDKSPPADQLPGCPDVLTRIFNLAWSHGKPGGFS